MEVCLFHYGCSGHRVYQRGELSQPFAEIYYCAVMTMDCWSSGNSREAVRIVTATEENDIVRDCAVQNTPRKSTRKGVGWSAMRVPVDAPAINCVFDDGWIPSKSVAAQAKKDGDRWHWLCRMSSPHQERKKEAWVTNLLPGTCTDHRTKLNRWSHVD